MSLFSTVAARLGRGTHKEPAPAHGPSDEFTLVINRAVVEQLAAEGKLLPMLLLPERLGGLNTPENVVYVPAGIPEKLDRAASYVRALIREGHSLHADVTPEYRGESLVPARIHVQASGSTGARPFEWSTTIEVW